MPTNQYGVGNYRWYIYELADPTTGLAFYVGKGSGDRIAAHERDALRSKDVCSRKLNKINELWSGGLKVERRFVAFFMVKHNIEFDYGRT